MSRFIGAILLIIGTSIGSGMLALPMVIAPVGFYNGLGLLVAAWAMMTLAAFYILEVNLWFPAGSNMMTMAHETLGRVGQLVTLCTYMILLYALLSAYAAGGGSLFHYLSTFINLDVPRWLDTMSFVVILGAILFEGVGVVDKSNRVVMTIKFVIYFCLLILIMHHVKASFLAGGELMAFKGAVLVVVTSFGYATIIPTLRDYLDSDVTKLRLAIGIGSLSALLIYVLWDLCVQGTTDRNGTYGLITALHTRDVITQLSHAMTHHINSRWIRSLMRAFTTICMVTSFLGVAQSLKDFVADGLKLQRMGRSSKRVILITLLPPLLIVLWNPMLFVEGLKYAGIMCVVLLMLIPTLMVWRGRYRLKLSKGYEVLGGKAVIIIESLLALTLLYIGVTKLWG